MANPPTARNVALFAIILALAFLAYCFLSGPDRRSLAQRVDNALHEIPHGFDKASRALDDRTIGDRLGDAIKDAGEKIKDTVNDKH